MSASSTDRIEKTILLAAPRARVWRAITDVGEFNAWFGVALTSAFTAGATSSGRVTNKGYEHLTVTIEIETMDPERLFAFRWHPDAKDPDVDYSKEPTTLVTFTLENENGGTRLTIVESGFDMLPEARRAMAFRGNDGGWQQQIVRIASHLAAHP